MQSLRAPKWAVLRAPKVGARSAPALRAQASPCPSRYRLEFVAPSLSVLLSLFGRVGFIAPNGGAPSSLGRCARLFHMFIGSIIGGATRSPSRPTSAFCPCSGLVAWLCANKGAPPRLPFRSPPSRSARWWRLPAPLGQSGLGLATLAPLFFRHPL